MVMLLTIRRGRGKSVVGQVSCPLDLKRPKYDRLKFCIATVLLPRQTPLKTSIEVELEMEALERSAHGHDCRKGELLHRQQCTFLV